MTRYFWSDPGVAAQAVRERFPASAQETVALADEICKNRFLFRGHWEMERTHEPVEFAGDIVWDQTPNGDPEWVFAFNRHTFLVTLGQAFRLTGRQRYADTAARLLHDWTSRCPLTEASKRTTWRPIEAGLRSENWLRALGLFGEALGAEVTGLGLESLREHAGWLMQAHTPFQKLSNWGVLQDHGLLLLGLALEQPIWCDAAAARLDEELFHQVLPDGAHWEQSPLYQCEVLHCCLDSLHAARRAGVALPPRFVERTRLLALGLGRQLRPDGKLLCQSDTDEVDARDLMALAALLFGDPALKGFAHGELFAENAWDFADEFDGYAAMEEVPPTGSTALPDSGNYLLWDGTGPGAGMLHMHCGSLGSGHGHADLLHVDLVYRGETILADSGRYTYVDSDMRRALKSPAGHNTIVVDERDFTAYRSSWVFAPIAEPVKGEHRFAGPVDFVSGAHLGYLSAGVVVRRRVLRLGAGLWLLWDDFHVADDKVPHRYDRYFHFAPEGALETESAGALYQGRRCAARLAFPGGGMDLRATREPLSREYNRLDAGDCLRVRAERRGPCALPTVIAVGEGERDTLVSAALLPLHLAVSGRELPAGDGQAVCIRRGEDEWTVMVANTDLFYEVSLLEAGGHTGHGRVLVFGPPCPDGICVSW